MQASDQKETQNWDNVLRYFPPGGALDTAATGGPTVPAKFSALVINVEPFDEMASLGYFDQNGGVVPTDPYPGNNPTAPGSHWLPNLGAQVLTNSVLDKAGCGILKSMATYPTYDFSDHTIVSNRTASGIQETLKAKLIRLGTGNGSGATGTATLGGGTVVSIAVVNPGSGYTDPPIATISGGGGSGATATVTINAGGQVVSITVTSPGAGYTSKPTVTITAAPKYGPKDYIKGYKYEAGFYYHNSYWLDMCVAMLHAVAVAHYSWLDQVNGANTSDATSGKPKWSTTIPAGYFDPAWAPNFVPGTLTRDHDTDGNSVADSPSTFDTIAEIDQQFLRNLGEWPGVYATGTRPIIANGALRSGCSGSLEAIPEVYYEDLNAQGSKNIKMLRLATTITLQQAALMELVVNDMRMSFFGASPDYLTFRPLDLDDNGIVSCSCYAGGSAPANAADGQGPVPEKWFSLTGCFTLQKSRYYHIFTRTTF